jgi:hypothetical protein
MSPGSGSRTGVVAVRVVLAATVCHGQPVATRCRRTVPLPAVRTCNESRVRKASDTGRNDREWEWEGDTGSSASRVDCRLPLARLTCATTPLRLRMTTPA